MRIPCWQAAFSYELQIPLGDQHQIFLDKCWCAAESGASGLYGGRNNPLGCVWELPNSTPLPGNTAGVREYKTRLDGIKAQVLTIKAPEYSGILTELRRGSPHYGDLSRAIGKSRWGTDTDLLLRLCRQYGLVG